MHKGANASDGAQTRAVRNADVPDFVLDFSMAPSHGPLPKNLAELSFAINLRFTACLSYSGGLENFTENLAVLFPTYYNTLASYISSEVSKMLQGVYTLRRTQLSNKTYLKTNVLDFMGKRTAKFPVKFSKVLK